MEIKKMEEAKQRGVHLPVEQPKAFVNNSLLLDHIKNVQNYMTN